MTFLRLFSMFIRGGYTWVNAARKAFRLSFREY